MRLLLRILLTAALVCPAYRAAYADIGLLLDAKPNEHLQFDTAEITGAGHSAVYLSRVCPATPVQLRLCGPGEKGLVIQNYQDYKEDEPYEWNAVPLDVYLYGVEEAQQKPLFASPEIRAVLQEQYRDKYLRQICSRKECISDPQANWRDSVAAAFVREIYIFEVHTTVEQDQEFIRTFNTRANVNHYSGFSRNCADFAKLVVNTYFPHSTHRDFLNDFGMTGPKAIARSFTHYAEHHPQLELRVVRIEQVPGTYKRSSDCKEGTEQAFRSAKWLVPMLLVGYHELPILAASYMLTGRFNPDHELRNHPSEDSAALYRQLAEARQQDDRGQEIQIQQDLKAEQIRELGDEQQWESARARFEEVLHSAVADGVVADESELHRTFRHFETDGRAYVDDGGDSWLEVQDEANGKFERVGLTEDNIFSAGSNQRLAFQLLLARTDALVSAKSKHRESWPEFQSDWALLQQAEAALPSGHARSLMATRIARPSAGN
jgi:hypothetical protein